MLGNNQFVVFQPTTFFSWKYNPYFDNALSLANVLEKIFLGFAATAFIHWLLRLPWEGGGGQRTVSRRGGRLKLNMLTILF